MGGFEQFLMMLMSVLGSQVNNNLQPGMPLGTQMTYQFLSAMMPPAIADPLARGIGPDINARLFGTGPLAGFGGLNTTWNYASRITQYNQEMFVQGFKEDINKRIADENERQYMQMMERRLGTLDDAGKAKVKAGMGSDWEFTAIKMMNAFVGADQVAYGVRDIAPSMGYTFGAGFGQDQTLGMGEKNVRIRKNLQQFSKNMLDSYMQEGGQYGNLTGRDVGDLIREMGRRGQLTNELGGEQTDFQGAKEKIQATSKALSGIRDIIKGSIPEVMRQLEATFGGTSINTLGIDKVANQVQQYRQLAESTGTSIQDMMTYARAVGAISNQTAGYNLNAAGGGLTVASILAGPPGDMRGIDSASYARSVASRVAGAQTSEISLLVAGAQARLREIGGDEKAFIAKLTANTQPLTAASIAEMSGLNMLDIQTASRTRTAREIMSTDKTSTYAALDSNRAMWNVYRRDQLRLLRNKEDGSPLSEAQLDEALKLSPLALEKKYGTTQVGNIMPTLDAMARAAGFQGGAEEQTKMYAQQDASRKRQDLASVKAAWAEEVQAVGGSFAAMVRNAKGGEGVLNRTIKDNMNKLLNMMEKRGVIKEADKEGKLGELLGSAGAAREIREFIGTGAGMDTRGKLVSDYIEKTLGAGGLEYGSPEYKEWLKNLGWNEETNTRRAGGIKEYLEQQKKEYGQTAKGYAELEKGKAWESMKHDEKVKTLSSFIGARAKELETSGYKVAQKDAQGNVKRNEETGEIEWETKQLTAAQRKDIESIRTGTLTEEEKASGMTIEKKIASNADILAKYGDTETKELLQKGPTRDLGEMLEEALNALKSIAKVAANMGGFGVPGSNDAPGSNGGWGYKPQP